MEFFRYIYYTDEGKALSKKLVNKYQKARRSLAPLFVTHTQSELSLVRFARARGNLPAYNALRETKWFSDRYEMQEAREMGLATGVVIAFGWFAAGFWGDVGMLALDNFDSAMSQVAGAALLTVGLAATGVAIGEPCMRAINKFDITRNSKKPQQPPNGSLTANAR